MSSAFPNGASVSKLAGASLLEAMRRTRPLATVSPGRFGEVQLRQPETVREHDCRTPQACSIDLAGVFRALTEGGYNELITFRSFSSRGVGQPAARHGRRYSGD